MTAVSKADKSRITIRGLVDGHFYVIREQPGGWFVSPEKKHRPKKPGLSAKDFATLYRQRRPLGDAADEVAANVAATRQASP